MSYQMSPEARRILKDVDHLRTEARALLSVASPGAREEWEKLESRFPSDLEIRRGFIALSTPELDEMRSKIRRFRDILATGCGVPPVVGDLAANSKLAVGDRVVAADEGGAGSS